MKKRGCLTKNVIYSIKFPKTMVNKNRNRNILIPLPMKQKTLFLFHVGFCECERVPNLQFRRKHFSLPTIRGVTWAWIQPWRITISTKNHPETPKQTKCKSFYHLWLIILVSFSGTFTPKHMMHGFILYSTLFEYKGLLSYKEKVIFMAIFRAKPV